MGEEKPTALKRELVEILVSLTSLGSHLESLRLESLVAEAPRGNIRLDLFHEALYGEVSFDGIHVEPRRYTSKLIKVPAPDLIHSRELDSEETDKLRVFSAGRIL